MYRIKSNSSRGYGVKEYVADTYDDLFDIDISHAASGSFVFVIDKSRRFMLNNNRTWVEIFPGSNGGGGGDGSNPGTLPPGFIELPNGEMSWNGGIIQEDGSIQI